MNYRTMITLLNNGFTLVFRFNDAKKFVCQIWQKGYLSNTHVIYMDGDENEITKIHKILKRWDLICIVKSGYTFEFTKPLIENGYAFDITKEEMNETFLKAILDRMFQRIQHKEVRAC